MAWGRAALLTMAAMTLGGCIRDARLALPSDFGSQAEQLALTGMGLGRKGDFQLAGHHGHFTRGAERLTILDPLLVRNGGAGSFHYAVPHGAVLEGACRYREGELNLAVISVRTRPFAYHCTLARNGALAGELVIREERGTTGAKLGKRGREGFLTLDGVRLEIASVHRDARGGLETATPLGYRFEEAGRTVGAVDLNGPDKKLFAPASGSLREAVFAGSLALSVLWDPATL